MAVDTICTARIVANPPEATTTIEAFYLALAIA